MKIVYLTPIRVMKKIANFAILSVTLATFTLTGCANIRTARRSPISVTTFVGAPNPFLKEKIGDSASIIQAQRIGLPYPVATSLLGVRECNNAMTSCSTGIAKITGDIIIQKTEGNEASLRLRLIYDLRRRQIISGQNIEETEEVSTGSPALYSHAEYRKTAILPFGQWRRISFEHGINFDICILPTGKYLQPIDDRCSIIGLQNKEKLQAAIPSL